MAITWRNVDGGQGALAAGRLLQGAEQSFNSGFAGLQDVLKQYRTQEQANWDAGKEMNTQAFMDRLSQVRTPEEMAALQASGELDRLKAGFGAQIDRNAVRTALDTRGDFLRQQATNQMAYDNAAQDHNDAPILNGFLAEARQIDIGDPKQVEAQLNQLEQKLAQSGLSERGQATAAQGLVDIRKSLLGDYKTTQDVANDRTRTNTQVAEAGQRMRFAKVNQEYVLQERAAHALASQAIEGAPDLATARQKYLASSGDLPAELRNRGLESLGTLYTQATTITPEQDEEIAIKLAPYEAEVAVAKEYLDSRPIFSQAVNENMSESDAIGKVTEMTPGEQDNTAEKFRRAIKVLRRNKDLNIPEDANLGPVILAAARMAGVDEAMIGDDHFNASDLEKVLPLAYKEYAEYMKYQTAYKTAETKLKEARQKEMDRYKIRNALTPSAK